MSKLKSNLKNPTSIVYVNIVKKLKNKDTEFHVYKLKQRRIFKVILKYIPSSSNVNDIRKEIGDQGYTVTII
jgi:ATP-dependent RNA circularization protein (DNA/RNA ligase family)